ncbi:MAG: ABC transporter ATP-binding protein [Eubacterium sp.]|nr:ABC transporter ATP-binding protein [Eubacterium sp.]
MLQAENIKFRYKSGKFEVMDISLNIEEGYIYCLLGENGCGKTTTMKLLYGMLTPDKGKVSWNGKTVTEDGRIKNKILAEYHREVAFTGTEWCAEGVSVKANVDILSKLYPSFDMNYFESLIKKAGLSGEMDKKYAALSRGQKVKIEIAFNLAKKPKLMILDEPLANLDPVYKVDILEILQNAVAEDNLSIIISTHLLDEITDMVDYIIFMKNGEITDFGDRESILADKGKTELRELFE